MQNKRVMLKLSGEALAKPEGGYNEDKVRDIAKQLKPSLAKGTDIGIVIGGGNYWRGRSSEAIDRTKADQIGMLATVMNCIYVSEIFRSEGMAKVFSKDEVNERFAQGKVVFFGGGTGHPYFSTDTGIVLRAVEMDVDIILLAKSIDGVYTADPKLDPDAKKYDKLTIKEVIDRRLAVVDLTASVMCLENKMPLAVFDLNEENSIKNALDGKINGTIVTV